MDIKTVIICAGVFLVPIACAGIGALGHLSGDFKVERSAGNMLYFAAPG